MWEPVAVVRAWSEESESVGAPSGVEFEEVVVEGAGAAVKQIPDRLLAGESGGGRVVSRSVSTVERAEPQRVGDTAPGPRRTHVLAEGLSADVGREATDGVLVTETARLSEPEVRPGVSPPSVGRLPPTRWFEGPEPWEESPVEESAVRSGELPPPEVLAKEHAEYTHGRRITPKSWPDDWYARRFEETVEEESADRDGLDESQRAAVIELVENESVASAVQVVGRLCLPPSAVEEVRVLLD